MAKEKARCRTAWPLRAKKTEVRPDIKEALGKALENRAKELGVASVTGLGMKDGPEVNQTKESEVENVADLGMKCGPTADKTPAAGTQGFLFGEGDKIRAALSSELVIINAEIGAAEKSKVNINEKIDCLSDRRRVVEDAMNALDKVRDKKKLDKKKPLKKV